MFDQLLATALCAVVPAIGMIVIGIIGTQARIEMVEQINRLKAHGIYAKWADQNKTIVYLERIGLTGSLLSQYLSDKA